LLNKTEREKTQNFFANQIILNDGNKNQKLEMKKNNPWISGSFYLFLAIVVIVGLSVVVKVVPLTVLPFVIIGGILLIGVTGAFQLKNDDKLSESNFIKLMQETYRRLPLLKSSKNKTERKND
jgi:amino acid transporter